MFRGPFFPDTVYMCRNSCQSVRLTRIVYPSPLKHLEVQSGFQTPCSFHCLLLTT